MPAWGSEPRRRDDKGAPSGAPFAFRRVKRLLWFAAGVLTGSAAAAEDAAFAQFGGNWGAGYSADLSCAVNPHRITFTADHQAATFTWDRPITAYDGTVASTFHYSVISSTPDRITMAIDNESRLTADGIPVVWILRLVMAGRAYCWGRTDWAPEQCVATHFRCPGETPSS